jgi:hypothetical protein
MLELHEYAASKVRETAPKMTPKIIVLKDKGFEIVLSKARVTDPKLRYRKAASRYANAGSIRPAGRAFLNTLRQQLDLTPEEAVEIETEVLRPYQQRLANLQNYREALIAEAEHEYPLSEEAREDISRLQELLGLRDVDVLPIRQEVEAQFAQQSAADRQNLVQYEQAFTKAIQSEYPLNQFVADGLKSFQQQLGLRELDITAIEMRVLAHLGAASKPSSDKVQSFEVSAQSTLEEVKNMLPSSQEAESKASKAIEVFFSYSHKDEELRDELATHLAMMKRQGVISAWHDRDIDAGDEWEAEILQHLNSARVILLLISNNFLASDFCYDKELLRAMERHEAKEARVIPIIMKPCDWNGAPFGKLQALPKNAKPVTKWDDRDEAFLNVAQGIRRAVQQMATSS